MTNVGASDDEWLQWIEVQKTANEIWMRKGASAAVAVLDRFLASDPRYDLRRDAIAFRGCIHEDEGDLSAAAADLLSALALAQEFGLERYSIETSLAAVSLRRGDLEAAEGWCVKALRTAASDPKTSGAGALLRLLRLRGPRGLKAEERALVTKVVHQAWSLLRVEGEPDLTDLEGACKTLIEAQKGPFSAERPPAPTPYSEPTPDH
jgi:hypothetical protein